MPTKICPHSLNAHGDLLRYVEAGSPLVKLVDFFGSAAELLALNPNLTIVGRVYESYDANAEARSGKSPQQAAQELLERQKEKYRLNPLIKIWEGPNEPVFGNADDPANVRAMEWYAAFEAERLRLLADLGLRGVVGNFATGTPDLPLWPAFLPAVEAAHQRHGFLGLHEYSSPWMWWLTGNYQTSNCEGRPDAAGEGDTGWLTLRYRKVYRQYLAPNGLGDVPLVITECGLDSIGAVCPGMTSGPWKKHFDFWRGHNGVRDPVDYWRANPERDVERYYAEQLMWYDRELQKDSYVAGATVFTVGQLTGWDTFDIGGMRVGQYLVDYIRAQPAAPLPPPPAPVAPPPPPAAPALNLLINGGFEEGHSYPADETTERAVPSGWFFSYMDEATPREARQTAPWGKPVTALLDHKVVTQNRLFVNGAYCWKIAGGNAPVWVRLNQSAFGFKPGGKYRFIASVLPNAITRDQPSIAHATDPLASEIKLSAAFAEQTFDSGWQTLSATPAGKYTRLTLDFAAPSGRADIALEVRGRWALPLGAWYVDELSVSPIG